VSIITKPAVTKHLAVGRAKQERRNSFSRFCTACIEFEMAGMIGYAVHVP
jgi:hypothetical protein